MLTYIRGFLSFKKDERAVTAVEYALIAAFIAAALIAALPTVGGALNKSFGNVSYGLNNAGADGKTAGAVTDQNG